ncbi:alkaline phosphatase family protein [Streptomyces sp. NPDC002787]
MVDAVGAGRPGRGRVLVVGMDGVRYDLLTRSPFTAPVLHGLMAAGAHGSSLLPYGEVDGQAEDGPSTSMAYTDSGPGWSSVLTGVWPDRHGVTGNDFTGADYSRHPDFLSRAVTARPGLRAAAAVSWPELVDRGTLGPAIGDRVRYDGETDGYESADRLVADTVVRWLTEEDLDVVFAYFGATDEAGHATGPRSPAYDRALLAQDAHLGRLLDAIGARRSGPARADEHWTVLVTTDHGHLDAGGHGGDTRAEREVFVVLAEPGTPGAPGTLVSPGAPGAPGGGRLDTPRLIDIAPTVLDRLGIPVDLSWGLRGRILPRPTTSSPSPPTSERS